jgi:sugar transferase (PEP-CTERM system associated)
MVTLFGHRGPLATLCQVVLEASFFTFAIVIAVELKAPGAIRPQELMLVPAGMFALLIILINNAFGLYLHDHPMSTGDVLARKVLALLLGVPIAYLSFSIFSQSRVFQDALGTGTLLALFGILCTRVRSRPGARSILPTHRILVVGTGPDAGAVQRAVSKSRGSGISIEGFYVANESTDSSVASLDRLVSSDRSLTQVVRDLHIDEIVIAVREQRGGALPLRQLVDCRLQGVKVTCLPEFYERFKGEIPIDSLKVGWLIYSDGFRQGWGRTVVKRIFDIVASTALLVPGLPLMLLAAVAIRLDSRGPLIYGQERVGLRGKTFRVLKFRSMTVTAERDGIPKWATKNDDRITRVGRLIRKTRIDELPQILNVLKGEMSLVGPRPERPFFVDQLVDKIPFYDMRHSVKPGITGWAQVRCPYGASTEDATEKLQYDLYYVKNHTLALDLIILVETVRVVLLGEGAR